MVTRGTILLVDDDPVFLRELGAALEERELAVTLAASLDEARRALEARSFDAAVVDIDLGPESGLDAIPILSEHAGKASVVAISGHASVASAVEAMRRGAFEFLEKPFSMDRLVETLGRALERSRLARENAVLRSLVATPLLATPAVAPELLGKAMREVHALAARAAALDLPVLVSGETGTGKEFVARAIHLGSRRAAGPWIAVNCGGFQRDLIDSELFGYEKGAFTGAREMRLGLVEVARGGTLFLDEVGELTNEAQTKLLRVIESGEFRRVGSTEAHQADVRVVAATNRDLAGEAASGRFRKDLLFRLDVVPIRVPSLRERSAEIPVFIEAFLRARGRAERGFRSDVMAALRAHDWPGNLRELRNVVDRLLLAGEPDKLRVEDLPPPIGPRTNAGAAPATETGETLSLHGNERAHIVRILELSRWNRRKAAAKLEIDPRTLYRKMREHSIEEPTL